MKFFTDDDFGHHDFIPRHSTTDQFGKHTKGIAEIANAKLSREAIVLYADNKGNVWERGQHVGDTHRALLICVEPIEACKHTSGIGNNSTVKCLDCGAEGKIETIVKWEIK